LFSHVLTSGFHVRWGRVEGAVGKQNMTDLRSSLNKSQEGDTMN